ncbi:uncharacterized protein LOC130982030 isoform X2 [Arachis stenosperma]|uniref:uncharacterized protein LOC130982030 isoform X2 n=1 Tax=Arachis stenosperma TaxID=217475 RepID=UPI0025AC9B9B|nr:uncharacterized protein LOC130982030 isoform X2 [Arachis stenosperma]
MSPDEVLHKGNGTLCEMLLMAYKANVICPNKHQSDKEKFYSNHLLEILALYRFWWGGFWKWLQLDQHFLEPRDYSLYYSFLDHNCFHSSSLETRTSPTKKGSLLSDLSTVCGQSKIHELSWHCVLLLLLFLLLWLVLLHQSHHLASAGPCILLLHNLASLSIDSPPSFAPTLPEYNCLIRDGSFFV